MAEAGDGFAHGGEAFGVDFLCGELGVCEREAGVLADGVHEGELFLREGVVADRGVDIDRAESSIAMADGGADGRANVEALDAVSCLEARVGHGVGADDAFAVSEAVLKDGAADVNACFVRIAGRLVIFYDGGFEFVGAVCVEHDAAALGSELAEDKFHDGGEEGSAIKCLGGQRGEAVDDLEMVDGGCGWFRLGEDDRIFVAGEGVLEFGFDLVGSEHADDAGVVGVGIAEDKEGGSDADLIAGLERDAGFDAVAVDVGAVLAGKVADEPEAGVGGQFGVSATDGVVSHGQGFTGATDQLRLIGGQFELSPAVGPLEDGEDEHAP